MRALVWHGSEDVRIEQVPDPNILKPRDAIIRVTSTAICGSDLHLYAGLIPSLMPGDILGHEFMGEVVEVGSAVTNRAIGDRVVVPAPICCWRCFFCRRDLWSMCDNGNAKAQLAETAYGYSGAGIFGYSHAFGGYAGGQAEYVRVPYADVGPFKVPDGMTDEQVLFLTDIFPTGYMAAENCAVEPGDTVAVWGCGPVGLFAIVSLRLLGAERIIAIDRYPERLQLAAKVAGAEILNYEEDHDVVEALKQLTGGRGPDAVLDAVGTQAHSPRPTGALDRALQLMRVQVDRPHVLRQAIQACRKGGTVSLIGDYGGFVNAVPMGAAFNRGLTFHMGQVHVHRYLRPLLERIQRGEVDPTFLITHRLPLDEAPTGYRLFYRKEDGCVKVVLRP